MYHIVYARQALKDIRKLKAAGLDGRAKALIALLHHDPFQTPPRYEALVDNLAGCFSRRINQQHRLVYQVFEEERLVKVLRIWSHYERL